MSIKEIINDSIYLSRNGRHLGAFTLLCAAIGAHLEKCILKNSIGIKKQELAMPKLLRTA